MTIRELGEIPRSGREHEGIADNRKSVFEATGFILGNKSITIDISII